MLEEGDVIEIKEGHQIYAKVPEHFVYSNKKGSFSLTRSNITVGGEFAYYSGKYVVKKTCMDGGSTGRDAYPNGHHVFCINLDDGETEIDFYQSGCFNAMITDIKPVGKATIKWVYDS